MSKRKVYHTARLSDGSKIEVYKEVVGRKYGFMRYPSPSAHWSEAPEIHSGLSKGAASILFVDVLKMDVMDRL